MRYLEDLSNNGMFLQIIAFICLYFTIVLSTITMNTGKTLVMFAVIAAFGFAMATVAVLPQAHAIAVPVHPSCGDNPGYTQGQESTHPCGGPKQR